MVKKGRKPLPINVRKTSQVKASFTPAQFATIRRNAERARMKPAVYVARAALRAQVKERLSPETLSQIKCLNRLNTTLNQLLVKINADTAYYCGDQLLRAVNELLVIRRLLMEKMMEDPE